MNEIVLGGLRAVNPLGAMAAFGLMRVLSQWGGGEVLLAWKRQRGALVAALRTPESLSQDGLVEFLVARMAEVEKLEPFTFGDKIDSEAMADRVRRLGPVDDCEKRAIGEWLLALACEYGGSRTWLDGTTANQGLLRVVREIGESLKPEFPNAAEAFQEALFGPWTYRDKQHSLGWDPATVRLGAFTHEAPTKIKENRSVRAAVWLAFESLPLFPCFYSEGRAVPRGFSGRTKRQGAFNWPVWRDWIGIRTLATVLGAAELLQERPSREVLRSWGITAVYRSRLTSPNDRYWNLQAAEMVA